MERASSRNSPLRERVMAQFVIGPGVTNRGHERVASNLPKFWFPGRSGIWSQAPDSTSPTAGRPIESDRPSLATLLRRHLSVKFLRG